MSQSNPDIVLAAPSGLLSRACGFLIALLAANWLCWLLAFVVFHERPLLLGTAVLAYALGLRHAVDADHIAAIDNVTRNMMQAGKRPLALGLYFSLGHSTIVFAASIAVAASVGAMQAHLAWFRDVGGVVGTAISATFLLIIGAANFTVLISIWRRLRRSDRADAGMDLIGGGLIAKLLGPRIKLITESWQMYPLGFLFGLGFDTASEIALLGIAAAQSSQGLPLWSILLFPALFTAAMALIDTADGFLMIGAYGWALAEPGRRLTYNFVVTLISVLIALFVGGIEASGLIADKFGLEGELSRWLALANESLGAASYLVILAFALIWAMAWLVGRRANTAPEALPIAAPE